MTPELALNLRNCAARRAHLAGADWVNASKDGFTEEAATARLRYFRELTTVDILGGHIPSPFDTRA